MLVLVVDDDEEYAAMIAHTLERDSHEVIITHTAKAAVKVLAQKPPDLAVLDIVLPDHSGLELCRLIRSQKPDTSILFLSGMDRTSDVIDALNQGGDDYVTKPFHPGELAARVKALSRRSPVASNGEPTPKANGKLSYKSIVVDMPNQTASIGGIGLNCSRIEVELLGLLAQYPGQVLTHAFLSEQIWGYQNVDDATLLKGHVSSLRKKIRLAGGDDEMIRTVHGVGYSLEPQKAA